MQDIVSLMWDKSQNSDHRIAYLLLDEDCNESSKITYSDLHRKARLIASQLVAKQLTNERVLLLYPAGIEFITAFLACLYAGVVAVPVPCPAIDTFENAIDKLTAIAKDANVSAILTLDPYIIPLTHVSEPLFRGYNKRVIDSEKISKAPLIKKPVIDPTAIAYLQYTSGSTSTPKGAIVRHQNLMSSLHTTGKTWAYDPESITITWAPHTHVYGLICGLLLPLYFKSQTIILPTQRVVANPLHWLTAMSRYKGTHSGGPNFGYELCIKNIKKDDVASLDLSHWKVAVNGGEKVQIETLRHFSEKFSSCGFNDTQFFPAYGMSEASGAISSKSSFELVTHLCLDKDALQQNKIKINPENTAGMRLVSSGRALQGLTIHIMDPETLKPVNKSAIGEICITGPSVISGYWGQQPLETILLKKGKVKQPYFRTGDLGFVLDKQLYLTGRLKELLVVNGKKYYPLDIENSVADCLQAFNIYHSSIVFSTFEKDREQIIFIQELSSTEAARHDTVINHIRERVLRDFGIALTSILFVKPETLPKTTSGKLQRSLSKQLYQANKFEFIVQKLNLIHPTPQEKNLHPFYTDIRMLISEVSELKIAHIDFNLPVSHFNFDSIRIIQLTAAINKKFNLSLTPDKLFEYSTLGAFVDDLLNTYREAIQSYYQKEPSPPPKKFSDIAIIGMQGIFPGASNLHTFWQNLLQGKNMITSVPKDVCRQAFFGTDRAFIHPIAGGFIENIALFDATFFNISPREAELMDPQQRLFLQVAWGAIEDAHIEPKQLSGLSVGLYVGVFKNDYAELLQQHAISDAYLTTGLAQSMLANRISYLLNLRGPSETIDTACSSSLVAIHHAVQAIHQGDCEMAIAGGVNLLLSPSTFWAAQEAGMLSPDGYCKTFDKDANGYVRSEGVAAILLKTLEQARTDGDYIYGIIKGSAVNHGGHVNSLTAPNPLAQAEVVKQAALRAEISLDTINYVETHGTGTALGDPIEINGLKKAFSPFETAIPRKAFCALGALKTHIGHLESAAGIGSVIKVLLAMQHQIIPGNLHFKTINPYIDLSDSPFYLPTQTQTWQRLEPQLPRRAGISSFGFGGTNAHLILEEFSNSSPKKQLTNPCYPFNPSFYWLPKKVVRKNENASFDSNHSDLEVQLTHMVSECIRMPVNQINKTLALSELGFDSIMFKELAQKISEKFDIDIQPAVFFSYPTIQALGKYLSGQPLSLSHHASKSSSATLHHDIAIIGMHGILPQSANLNVFWEHLIAEHDLTSEIPPTRWDIHQYYGDPKQDATKSNSKWGALIEGVDQFAASFFNISTPEANLMDPQQRLFLEVAYGVIENAGYEPSSFAEQPVGVFVGVEFSDYQHLLSEKGVTHGFAATGVSHALLANRVSYFLNLQGPSEVIDTACSSSLVAIHRAVTALRNGECQLAIAGGVSLMLDPATLVITSQLGVLSPDGKCKTFDKSANGYVKGEGVAALLLKPLEHAQKDGDHIYGIIKGSAVNHGGKGQSLTAPNAKAQSHLLINAYQDAQIDPHSVTYIEAHGTGTELGDPIEIEGLKLAFKAMVNADHKYVCGIGSVKTNIGHLEPASGIAGTLKVLLAMQHGVLPKTLHFSELNPYIQLTDTPFYIVNQTCPWLRLNDTNGEVIPRRAGISSFGFGGTNAHLVLEEYLSRTEVASNKSAFLLTLSAKDEGTLYQKMADLKTWLQKRIGALCLERLSYTLNAGRDHFNVRSAMVVATATELMQTLEQLLAKEQLEHAFVDNTKLSNRHGPVFTEMYHRAMHAIENASQGNDLRNHLLLLADLYTKQYPIDWTRFHANDNKQRIAGLPLYPFQRQRYWFDVTQTAQPVITMIATQSQDKAVDLHAFTLRYLQQIFSEKLRLTPEQLSFDETYEVYGVDSLLGIEIATRMEKDLGALPKTLLYEKNTLTSLALYLQSKYKNALLKLSGTSADTLSISEQSIHEKPLQPPMPTSSQTCHPHDIAIIGMDIHFPMATDLDTFWENLKTGRDCITEVPKERWDYKDYPVDVGGQQKFFKYGGFLADIDKFDPLFFNIAPRDAALMDPQERLILQSAWATFEDAGYTRKTLQAISQHAVGVFIGVTYNFYPLFIAEEWFKGQRIPLDVQLFSVANRISYFFDLKGPSFIIDTACSSSLAAIHQACESLRNNDCQMALAGGVNLSLHPSKYHMLGSYSFMSEQGRCAAFGEGGSGYVPSEGVGCVLLKPLDAALKQGDRIYGVIKASGMNHGGKTSGYTVPNPSAQADLIKTTLAKANINARSISYIEAHGTGTALGDPIEIRGLQEAFENDTADKQFCAIGSVKSNIGHLESAAGISQLAKVLLQMQHKQQVPSIHTEKVNPFIDFATTPFYLQREFTDWKTDNNITRRAGISSFGAGGTNVHLVVEEFILPSLSAPVASKPPYLFLISGMDAERLEEYTNLLSNFINKKLSKETSNESEAAWLCNLAYTSQIGRESMRARLAILFETAEQLLVALQAYRNDKTTNIFLNYNVTNQFNNELVQLALSNNDMQTLAKLWTQGYLIDWEKCYTHSKPSKIYFPTYPFAKRRCWVPTVAPSVEKPETTPAVKPFSSLEDTEGWLYEMKWIVQPLNVKKQTNKDEHWLIFSDKELGFLISQDLQAQLSYCFIGDDFIQHQDNVFYLRPTYREDYQRLLASEKLRTITGIIYLWALPEPNETHVALANLFKALSVFERNKSTPFCLVTRSTQGVKPTHQIHSAHYLWSFTRIFAAEQANYPVLLVDLDHKKSLKREASWIASELQHFNSYENHVAYREEQRYVNRLLPYEAPSLTQSSLPKAVLITGGLGALGSEVAKFLIKQGTRYLVLTGTKPLPPRATWNDIQDPVLKEKLENFRFLETHADKILYKTADITNVDQMQQVVAEAEQVFDSKLDGVFHLAGVTTDNVVIHNMSDDLLKEVLAVKMQGALVLDSLFAKHTLKQFVLFSSIAALPYFGMSGLSAYAMANEYLNGLALSRRQRGLPAMSISWAAWADKGMSFRYNHSAFLEAVGMSTISIEHGIKILAQLMHLQPANVVVFKVDWQKFLTVNPETRKLAFFEHFAKQYASVTVSSTLTYYHYDEIITLLLTELAALLGLEASEIDCEAAYQNYGLDSIIGVNFVAQLGKHFPNVVSPMDLYRYPSVTTLARFIAEASAPPQDTSLLTVVPEVDKLLDENELNRLLEVELNEIERMVS